MGNRISATLSVLAFLFLVGVGYVGYSQQTRPADTDYGLTIEAKTTGDVVRASGTTNLPDGARFHVYLDRMYRLQDRSVWRSARIGEAEVVVKGPKWTAEIPVDETEWVGSLHQKVQASMVDPVDSVLPKLRATAVFSPVFDQSKEVQESMGPGFEALATSDAAVDTGVHWILRRQTMVDKPIRLDLKRMLLQKG